MNDKSIAVAVDGSDAGMRALRTAVRLADATGRSLVLVHVHPSRMPQGMQTGAFDKDTMRKVGETFSKEIFDEAEAVLGGRRHKPERVLLWGDPAEELVEWMNGNPEVHLVMGRRGHSKIRALLLGSVSDKVVRHARGLVTVVS